MVRITIEHDEYVSEDRVVIHSRLKENVMERLTVGRDAVVVLRFKDGSIDVIEIPPQRVPVLEKQTNIEES